MTDDKYIKGAADLLVVQSRIAHLKNPGEALSLQQSASFVVEFLRAAGWTSPENWEVAGALVTEDGLENFYVRRTSDDSQVGASND